MQAQAHKDVVKNITTAVQLEEELQISQAQHGVAVLDVYNGEWGNCKALSDTFRRLYTDAGDLVHLRFFSVECNAVLESLSDGGETMKPPSSRQKGMEFSRDTQPTYWKHILEERMNHSKPYFAFFKEGKMRTHLEGIDTPKICRIVHDMCKPQNGASECITNADALRFWESYLSPSENEVTANEFTSAMRQFLGSSAADLSDADFAQIAQAVQGDSSSVIAASQLQIFVGDNGNLKDAVLNLIRRMRAVEAPPKVSASSTPHHEQQAAEEEHPAEDAHDYKESDAESAEHMEAQERAAEDYPEDAEFAEGAEHMEAQERAAEDYPEDAEYTEGAEHMEAQERAAEDYPEDAELAEVQVEDSEEAIPERPSAHHTPSPHDSVIEDIAEAPQEHDELDVQESDHNETPPEEPLEAEEDVQHTTSDPTEFQEFPVEESAAGVAAEQDGAGEMADSSPEISPPMHSHAPEAEEVEDDEDSLSAPADDTVNITGEEESINQIYTDHWMTVSDEDMLVWNAVAALPLHYPQSTTLMADLSNDPAPAQEALVTAEDLPTLAEYLASLDVPASKINMMCIAADQKVGSDSLSYGKLSLILMSCDIGEEEGLVPQSGMFRRELCDGTLLRKRQSLAFTALALSASEAYADECFCYCVPEAAVALFQGLAVDEIIILNALTPLNTAAPEDGHFVLRIIGLPKVIELATTDDSEDTMVLSQWFARLRVVEHGADAVTAHFVENVCDEEFQKFISGYTARLIEDENRLDRKRSNDAEDDGKAEDDEAADLNDEL